jgi:hypothetical protein
MRATRPTSARRAGRGGLRRQARHFDRLELVWIPDGGTAAAALRTGEVDWVEYPLPDLVPVLERDRNVRTQVYDPNGFLGFLRFNHLHPPFSDVAVRRAIRDVLGQPDFMQAVALPDDWRECHSMFPCGLPGADGVPARAARRGGAPARPRRPARGGLCRRADHPHQPERLPRRHPAGPRHGGPDAAPGRQHPGGGKRLGRARWRGAPTRARRRRAAGTCTTPTRLRPPSPTRR